MDKARARFIDEGEAAFDPASYGARMNAEKFRDFRNAVRLVDFDAADVVPPCHSSARLIDVIANVRDAPDRDAPSQP